MVLHKAPEVKFPERNFGHAVLMWRIKNFSLAACCPQITIESSEFTISGPENTVWKLSLFTNPQNVLVISLHRYHDGVKQEVQVSWRAIFLDGEGEGSYVIQRDQYFPEGFQQSVEVIKVLNVIRQLSPTKPDELYIKLAIIVNIVNFSVYKNVPRRDDDEVERDFETLSRDFGSLLSQSLIPDIIGTVSGFYIKLHKAMLCCRSEILADSMRPKTKKTFDVHLTDVHAVNSLFNYMYTADLSFLFNPPLISIPEYINYFGFRELQSCYPQERLSIESIIDADEFIFTWTIINFKNIDRPLDGEVLHQEGMDSSWKLHIHPKGLAGSSESLKTYVYIEASLVESCGPKDVYVEFSTMNDKGKRAFSRRTEGRVEVGGRLGLPFFRIGGTRMENVLVDNTLIIYFSVHVATGGVTFYTRESHPPIPLTISNEQTLVVMSNMMSSLMRNEEFSDITLLVEDQPFKAHKCILAARSSAFFNVVTQSKEEEPTITLPNIKKHAFRVFLEYLYTGIVKDCEIDVLIQLCDMSRTFGVPSLMTISLRLLQNELGSDNACEMFAIAHDRKLAKLKISALNFIAFVPGNVKVSSGWKKLHDMRPDLFLEVEHFLNISEQTRSYIPPLESVPLDVPPVKQDFNVQRSQ